MSKTALCIGINDYPGTNMDLHGCVNDANDWAAALADRGFTVRKLLNAEATKAAMVNAMGDTIGSAKSGDSVVITYSGHGTYAPDQDGDEVDGLDEALCPHDIRAGGPLLDDEIRTIFAARGSGVRLLLISDSCHSGTVTRAAATEPEAEGPRPRFMPMGNWLPDEALPRTRSGDIAPQIVAPGGQSPLRGVLQKQQGDLLLAGCAEGPNNFSYDAYIAQRYNGAFTVYALRTLRALQEPATYNDWHQAIRRYLPSASYAQTPQIFGDAAARARKPFA
jgi:hypothetical protein